MPFIDDRGRVLGRYNLLDLALIVFVLALLPIGIVAMRVFRETPPRIDSVSPASQPAGPARRIRVKGANFRPYLRVFVNPAGQPFSLVARNAELTEGHFLIESPSEVEIQLPPVTAGSYDLYVFDEAREVVSRQSAFTIEPPVSAPLRATVRFVVLADVAALVKAGDADLADAAAGPADAPTATAVIEEVAASSQTVSAVESHMLPAGRTTLAVAGPARTLEAQVAVPAQRNGAGVWMYRSQPIRPGDAISFETARYSMRGLVVAVEVRAAGAAAAPGRSAPQ
jgi:hypothetical protein